MNKEITKNLLLKFKSEYFQCEENINLGTVSATFYAYKKVRWYAIFPNLIHYYVFEISNNTVIDVNHVLSLHSIARNYTDKFKNKCSRWFRWGIPITVTLILSKNGFDNETIQEIKNIKQRYQMGDVNTIVLVNIAKREIYTLKKTGYVGCLPLARINKYTVNLFKEIDLIV